MFYFKLNSNTNQSGFKRFTYDQFNTFKDFLSERRRSASWMTPLLHFNIISQSDVALSGACYYHLGYRERFCECKLCLQILNFATPTPPLLQEMINKQKMDIYSKNHFVRANQDFLASLVAIIDKQLGVIVWHMQPWPKPGLKLLEVTSNH